MRAGEQVTRARDFGLTDDADVAGLGTFRALLDLVLDLGAFGEALEALAGDRAEVHEDVVTAVGLRDEAVALRVVEPLHGSGCHVFHLPAPSRTCSGGVIALPVLALDDLWREKGSAFGAAMGWPRPPAARLRAPARPLPSRPRRRSGTCGARWRVGRRGRRDAS